MTTEDGRIPQEEIQRRIDQTIEELRQQGPDSGPQLGDLAAPTRRRRNWLLFAGVAIVAFELAVLGVAARIEEFPDAPAPVDTPCRSALNDVVTALSQYREMHDALPGSLEQLVPHQLPAVPRPRQASLQYEAQGQGYSLRCVSSARGGQG